MNQEADNLDVASTLTQQLNDAYVANAMAKAAPEQVQRADGSWPSPDCECGEPIPEPRLKLGRIRCIDCQQALERGRRCAG